MAAGGLPRVVGPEAWLLPPPTAPAEADRGCRGCRTQPHRSECGGHPWRTTRRWGRAGGTAGQRLMNLPPFLPSTPRTTPTWSRAPDYASPPPLRAAADLVMPPPVGLSLLQQTLDRSKVRRGRNSQRNERQRVAEHLATKIELCELLVHGTGTAKRPIRRRQDTNRASARLFDSVKRPMSSVGPGLETHDIALGDTVLQKRHVVHVRGVLTNNVGPQTLSVVRQTALARHELEPDLDRITCGPLTLVRRNRGHATDDRLPRTSDATRPSTTSFPNATRVAFVHARGLASAWDRWHAMPHRELKSPSGPRCVVLPGSGAASPGRRRPFPGRRAGGPTRRRHGPCDHPGSIAGLLGLPWRWRPGRERLGRCAGSEAARRAAAGRAPVGLVRRRPARPVPSVLRSGAGRSVCNGPAPGQESGPPGPP
jgi:hypothetical protein